MTSGRVMFDAPSFFFSRYLIPSLDRANAGHYRCIVRNRVGAIMQCSTEVQVACELMLCSPPFTLSFSHFSPFPALSCHPVFPITCFLPFAIVLIPFPFPISPFSPLHCLPALIRRATPLPPSCINISSLPLSSPAPHLVFSLRQIWAVSWRPSDPRRCRRARARWCTRRGYTASPGRRSPGSETAAKFPPAAACECTCCFLLGEVSCWSVLSLLGKVHFIFQCIFMVFFVKVQHELFSASFPPPPPPSQYHEPTKRLRRNFLVAVPPCSSLNLPLPIKRVIISALLTLQAG